MSWCSLLNCMPSCARLMRCASLWGGVNVFTVTHSCRRRRPRTHTAQAYHTALISTAHAEDSRAATRYRLLLGFRNGVCLCMQVSEDHCWLNTDPEGGREGTIEVTTDSPAKRALPVGAAAWQGWLYSGGHAPLCSHKVPHQPPPPPPGTPPPAPAQLPPLA